MKYYWDWFCNALFPPRCLVCGREGRYLCIRHEALPPAPHNEAQFEYLDHIKAVTAYQNPTVHALIEQYKFKGCRDLAPIMAYKMAEFIPLSTIIYIVPIPLHIRRWVWRGFNQSHLLAKAIQSIRPDIKIIISLKRPKATSQQARLNKESRIKNMQRAFTWKGAPPPSEVILIDDVVASGTTLDAAAKVLKAAGAERVTAIVFARGG